MHTLGPWNEDDKHTGGARAIIGDGQQLVALVYGKTAEECAENARRICGELSPSAPLDFSDFTGPKLNTAYKPDAQELVYEALKYIEGDGGDADEDAADQFIERLIDLLRRINLKDQGLEPCDVCGNEVDMRADACHHCG